MKQIRSPVLLMLAVLLLLAGCSSNQTRRSADLPAEETGQNSETEERPAEEENAGVILEENEFEEVPSGEGETITVDGQELEAVRYVSPLGYSMLYPEDQVTVVSWDDGDNFQITGFPGTYLAVSLVDAENISSAVEIIRFENVIDEDPTGFLFGSEGYAGVRMVQKTVGLTQEYVLVENNHTVFLLERAVYTGGEEFETLLQGMLDSFTIL